MAEFEASRAVRRAIYALERSQRSSEKWSPWQKVGTEEIQSAYRACDEALPGVRGWTREAHTVWKNDWLCVIVRTIKQTSLGIPVEHAAFRTATMTELSWKEKQRLKDELWGPSYTAIEIFPRKSDLIDAANMYHLWVLPEHYRFDFGLGSGQQ